MFLDIKRICKLEDHWSEQIHTQMLSFEETFRKIALRVNIMSSGYI